MKYSVWLATYQLYAIGDLFSSHHDHRRTNNPRAFCSKMAPYRSLNFIVCASTLLFITYGSSFPFLIWPVHLIVSFVCREIQGSFHAFFNVNCIEFHINIQTNHERFHFYSLCVQSIVKKSVHVFTECQQYRDL